MMNHIDAKKIIRTHQATPKVDVYAIAKDLGLDVIKRKKLKNSISGMIIKKKDRDIYEIHVNATQSEGRQRFTICHEIAHFLIHKDLIGDGITDDGLFRSSLSNEQEVMANKLAAEILMPWHLINEAIAEGNNSIKPLAELFGVSESAMSIRLGIPYYP